MRFILFVSIVLSSVDPMAAADEKANNPEAKLLGIWKTIRVERDAKKSTTSMTQIVFKKGARLEIHETDPMFGNTAVVERFKLRARGKTMEIDLGQTTDEGKPVFGNELKDGTTEYFPCSRGIYKLEKDKLTICWQYDAEKPRPKTFSTKDGDGKTLWVLERVESETKAKRDE